MIRILSPAFKLSITEKASWLNLSSVDCRTGAVNKTRLALCLFGFSSFANLMIVLFHAGQLLSMSWAEKTDWQIESTCDQPLKLSNQLSRQPGLILAINLG